MKYIVTAPQIQLTDKTKATLSRHINKLSRHLPSRLTTESIHISLKQNLAHNNIEGIATLHLPGRTLVVKTRARTIKHIVNALFAKMHSQVIRYVTTHDRSHSQFPDKATIRKTDNLQLLNN